MLGSELMKEFTIDIVARIQEFSFFRATRHTMAILMPIAVVGSYFKLFNDLIFTPNGLIYNIFNLDTVLSDHIWYGGSFVCRGMVEITFGVFGVYASYFMARYTARLYHKDSTMAGLTAVLIMLFCSYASSSGRNARMPFTASLLQINAVFIALIIGYCVGQIFHLLGKDFSYVKDEGTKVIQKRAGDAVLPSGISLMLGILLGILIYELQLKLLNSASFNEIVSRVQTTNNFGEVLILSAVITFLDWLGIGYPLRSLSGTVNNAFTAENLTYTLKHGNSWNVPYKYLGSSLINSYGIMGGASVALAVIVLLLIRRDNRENEINAKINLLPAAFGSTLGFTIGLPLILNPVFILPSVLIPIINMTLAAFAISVHIIPVSVYQILKGTPGILVSFFGTNGNWPTLIFTLLLFLLDIILLLPVIRINEKIGIRIAYQKKERSDA